MQLSSSIEVVNIPLGASLTEKSINIGEAMKIQISCRDENDSPTSFRMSHVSGGVTGGRYISVASGAVIFEADLRMTQSLYFASKTENAVVEVLLWK